MRAEVYSETRATEYANLAGAAYCSKESVEQWDCGPKCIPGVSNVHVCNSSSGTQAYTARWNNECLVSFEGTASVASMLADFHATRTSFGCEGCSVHTGFLSVWRSIQPCILEGFKIAGCDTTTPIRATGHSLGAAV